MLRTRVLLLRHAESADPTVFHGAESDVGLSERGRRQAEAIAPLLAAEAPHVVISSSMRRAVETATPIARACKLPLVQEAGLHERRVGPLAGQPTDDREGVWPETLSRWVAGETSYAPPGAESYDDISNRVLPIWQRLTQRYTGQSMVIVAHGVVCKLLLLTLLDGFGPEDWKKLGSIRNVAVSELVNDVGRWHAVRLNDLAEGVPAS